MTQVLLREDFEDDTLTYAPSHPDSLAALINDGISSYYGIVTPSGTHSNTDLVDDIIYNNPEGTRFYSAMETTYVGNGPSRITLQFNQIDVSAYTNLSFDALFAENTFDNQEDWDADSSVKSRSPSMGAPLTRPFWRSRLRGPAMTRPPGSIRISTALATATRSMKPSSA